MAGTKKAACRRPGIGWRGRSRTAAPHRVNFEKRDLQHLHAPWRTCPDFGGRHKKLIKKELVDFHTVGVHTRLY